MTETQPFTLGWEEWIALPGLGLPAIKAKVDTGARTSALHAEAIEPFGRADKPQVRFLMRPNPDDPSIEVTCSAKVVDRRNVTSSNGESELRYVIETEVEMGARRWPVELTLTDRGAMNYRMLLGRTSIEDDMIVSPSLSFAQPELDYSVYNRMPRWRPVKRPLRVALLTREPDNYSSRRLIEAGEARGHVVEAIDTSRCYMKIDSFSPQVHYDGRCLARYDAVIPRVGASMTGYGMAVMRQFEMTGAHGLNSAESIGASRDKLLAHQRLASAGINMPVTAFAHSPKDNKDIVRLAGEAPVVLKLLQSTQGRGVVLAETRKAAESLVDAFRNLDANFLVQGFVKEAAGADVRCLVVGGKCVGAMKRQAPEGEFRSNLHRGGEARKVRLTPEERRIAVRAARCLGLAFAGVDILQTSEGPAVLEVNSSPGLEGIEKATRRDIASQVYEYLERRVRPLSRVRESGRRTSAAAG